MNIADGYRAVLTSKYAEDVVENRSFCGLGGAAAFVEGTEYQLRYGPAPVGAFLDTTVQI